MVLPCALFNSGATVVDLRGGTNVEMAPQIDYITTVRNFIIAVTNI